MLFRRKLFERFGGFDERLENLEDWDLWRRYSSARDMCFVNEVTSLYRVPASASVAAARQWRLDRYHKTIERIWNEPSESNRVWGRIAFEHSSVTPRWALHNAARFLVKYTPGLFRLYWNARMRWMRHRFSAKQREY